MNKNIFSKSDIIYKIAKKLNNTIQRRLLDDIVNIITNYILEEVSNNKVFTVTKFGSFYQGTRKPRLVWSNTLGKKIMSTPRLEVRFSPHITFSKLLKLKRNSLIDFRKTQIDVLDKKNFSK